MSCFVLSAREATIISNLGFLEQSTDGHAELLGKVARLSTKVHELTYHELIDDAVDECDRMEEEEEKTSAGAA